MLLMGHHLRIQTNIPGHHLKAKVSKIEVLRGSATSTAVSLKPAKYRCEKVSYGSSRLTKARELVPPPTN